MILKKIFLLSIAALQLTAVWSQNPTEVKEKEELIGDISGNALYVNVYRAEEKIIVKQLKSELKNKNGDVKTRGKKLSAIEVVFPSISDSTLTVKAEVQEVKELVYDLFVIFKYNDTILSSTNNTSGYNSAKAFLFDLANNLSKEASEKYFAKQEKEFASLEKKLKLLKKKLVKEEKAVVKAQKLIKKNQSVVEKIDRKDKLDEKAIKARAKSEKAILNGKEKVKDGEYNVEINKRDQKETLSAIKKQRELVNEAKKSLDVFK